MNGANSPAEPIRPAAPNPEITVTRGPPLHRRNSSQWIPPTAPIYERAMDLTTNVTVRAAMFWRTRNKNVPDRVVEPNWTIPHVPRYHLPNFKKFCNNKVRTSKYTWYNFLPKNLFEQLHRWANIYFIIIMALQAFSRYLGMIPVITVLSMTAIKDFLEDWRRKRADRRLNHRTVHVWDTAKRRFRKTLWELVLVGDLIHVSCDDHIPADIVLLRSSDPQGSVYVETSNLDGETNLKQKSVVAKCKKLCVTNSFDPSNLYVKVLCNAPDNRMNHINGQIVYENGESENIKKDNVILRGCQVRNTSFAEGIVIYTGKETKLMLSNGPVRYKRSSIERMTNWFIMFCVLLLVIMVVSSGICSIFWLKAMDAHERNIPFIVLFTNSAINDGLINMAAYILVYQNLIPLSLYISIEIIKLGQNYLMTQDLEMYDAERDKKLLCRSLNIPEELGQIKYILSDKTGTLTENKMIFKSCAIGGEIFEPAHARTRSRTTSVPDEDPIAISHKLSHHLIETVKRGERDDHFYMLLNMAICNTVMVRRRQQVDEMELGYFENNIYNVGNSAFYVPIGSAASSNCEVTPNVTAANTPNATIIRQFAFSPTDLLKRFGSLSSLSKIFTKRDPVMRRLTQKVDENNYDAESPDELALVKAASAYGFTLISRSPTEIRLQLSISGSANRASFTEDEIEVEVVKVLPFDSNRKRMSVVVRFEDRLLLLCKGADEQMLPHVGEAESAELLATTKAILEDYGRTGLRTLCMAMRELDPLEFAEWMATREFVESIDADEQDELLCESSRRLETDLHLLGVTAIEDRLQNGVTDTVESLRKAGIQVWVLTGDKCETAVNIAKSCHLFNRHLETRIFHGLDDLHRWLAENPKKINAVFSSEIIALMKKGNNEVFRVIQDCSAIVCFRMTPAEKAEVVDAVKRHLKGKALAVGDGANDVPMILGADVGVGISGHEGLQAVMASDFAISRFRFLKKLLLVHGHWNYHRLSNVIMYFLHKNALFVLIIFWAQLFMGFSSGYFIDPIYSMLYPIVFTSIFDQDVSKDALLRYPILYEQGLEARLCTYRNFSFNMVDAFYQSAVIFYIPYLCFSGADIKYWELSFVLSTAMFFANSVHLALLIRRWTWPLIIVQVVFVGVHFMFFFLYTQFVTAAFNTKDPPLLVAANMIKQFQFWSCVLLTVVIALLPRFFLMVMNTQFWPDLNEITLRHDRKFPVSETEAAMAPSLSPAQK